MKRTITENQRLQLIGLLTLAEHHNAMLKQIERAACAITGESDGGHTGDAVYGSRTLEELLTLREIEVTES